HRRQGGVHASGRGQVAQGPAVRRDARVRSRRIKEAIGFPLPQTVKPFGGEGRVRGQASRDASCRACTYFSPSPQPSPPNKIVRGRGSKSAPQCERSVNQELDIRGQATMHVLVLGSGVIGVSSAWYLSRAGFEVTVVDREPGPALETSFANAGQISPGYAAPWAAPGVPLKALKWLFSRDAPLVIKPGLDPRQYIWLLQMLRNCTAKRYAINKARMLRLARYSAECLDELADELGIDYEARKLGTLQLFRTQAQLDAAGGDIAVLDQYGVPYELLDRAGIVNVEPALAEVADQFTGALRLPEDQTGDCALFTRLLAERAKAAGVEFRFGATVEALETSGERVIRARIDGDVVRADKYVLALGSYTPRLLAPLGIDLP